MVQNVNPTFVKTPNRGLVNISTGTGTASVTLYTGGANGSKISGINATLSSSASATVRFQITNGGTNYVLGTVTLASSTGVDGASASANLLAPSVVGGIPLDSDGNPFLFLSSSADTLTIGVLTTLPGAGNTVFLIATAGDF